MPEMTKFDWTLNSSMFRTTIYNKKKCVEVVDILKLYSFIHNEMGITYEGIKRYNGVSKTYLTELKQMKDYKNLYSKKTETFDVSFELPKHKWGRIIPNKYLSLSIFHRPTRHAFCEDNYIDYDMVNCQPKIISEVCKHHDIPCKALDNYVSNTKEMRSKIMEHHNVSKDVAKRLPICIMFGGLYERWLTDNKVDTNKQNLLQDFCDIENEMKNVIGIVYANNKHIEEDVLKQDCNKWKNENEAKRGVMALWSQSVERLIQENCIQYLVDNKQMPLEEIVPCQDGFMILKKYKYDTLCQDLETLIKKNFNIHVEWSDKEFDEAIEIPSYDGEIRSNQEWIDLLSRKKLADMFCEMYGEFVIKEGNSLYVFWNNKWYDETIKDNRYKLTLYIAENLYEVMRVKLEDAMELNDKEKNLLLIKLRDETSRGNSINDIIKHILTKTKIADNIFNQKPFLLGFDNGVYDLQVDEFRDYRYEDYMTMTTGYDYSKPDYSIPEKEQLRKTLVEIQEGIQPNPEERLYYQQILASGLDGLLYQNLFLFNGEGGNGKSMTSNLMNKTLGNYFHQPGNGILKDVEKSNVPSPDLFNLKNKRYVCFTEVGGIIKVSVLRNLSGGGDFQGRLLHQNPEKFKLVATIMFEFNNAPDLDGKPMASDYRRIRDIEFPCNFTEDENKIGKVINGKTYLKANKYYETEEFYFSMRDVFLDLLLETYRKYKDGLKGMKFTCPKSISQRSNTFLENQNLFQKVFNENFKKVAYSDIDKAAKTQSVKSVWECIKYSEEYKALSFREKRQYNREEFYKWISGLYTIDGNTKTGKLIIGLVRNDDDNDDETF